MPDDEKPELPPEQDSQEVVQIDEEARQKEPLRYEDLSGMRKKFVLAYVEGTTKGNAAASARKAGYSPKASNAMGARLYRQLKHIIMLKQGREVDVKREVWHKDRESSISKITQDLESLEAKHANKPKYWDMLLKLRGWYSETGAGTPLITLAVQGGLHLYAQKLAKEMVDAKVVSDVTEVKVEGEEHDGAQGTSPSTSGETVGGTEGQDS